MRFYFLNKCKEQFKIKTKKRVNFAPYVIIHPTYSPEEYDRTMITIPLEV
jgi:uncharacterized protein YlaI